MSQEARMQVSLQIKRGSAIYQSQPTAFTADVSGFNGPVPGTVSCSQRGTDIDLTQLTTPGGLIRIMNLDAANWIEVGAYDPLLHHFTPMQEYKPGESFIWRMSRKLGTEMGTGTGTGTLESGIRLRIKGVNAAVIVLVEAFDG